MIDESTSGVSSYMNYVANAASFEAFNRHDEAEVLLSAEALPENSSFLNFSAFAKDHPEKFFELLSHLRPEFQELCIEYYVLHKPQWFIGKAHGFIQTRTWQNLRIIEQAIGAFILLGTNPDEYKIRPVVRMAGLEETPYGSLTKLILLYNATRNYAAVAKTVGAPIPAIRKIFRPAIATLLADKDILAVAVGAYLRNLTHHAALTRAGFSKAYLSRLRRMKVRKFVAPPSEHTPLLSFGRVESLADAPWCMFEISSDHRMAQLYPALKAQGKRIFKKKPAQIFAPVTADGELAFGYIFARSTSISAVRALKRMRGISEMAAIYTDDGAFAQAITAPHADVQKMMETCPAIPTASVLLGDFVEILTGPAARYCGTVTAVQKTAVTVEVNFPTDRKFIVTAAKSGVKLLPNVAPLDRAFWGARSN
jgi:hypothetical protein